MTAARIAALAAAALLACGCRHGQTYVEGTLFEMGLYIPYDGSLYGLQVCRYCNGTIFTTPSNSHIRVERTFASTNDYFGMVHTRDASHTKAESE